MTTAWKWRSKSLVLRSPLPVRMPRLPALLRLGRGIRLYSKHANPSDPATALAAARDALRTADLGALRTNLSRLEDAGISELAGLAASELSTFEKMQRMADDLELAAELAALEAAGTPGRASADREAASLAADLQTSVAGLPQKRLLSLLDGPYDTHSATISIFSPLGPRSTGFDSRLWVGHLEKMYRAWAAREGYSVVARPVPDSDPGSAIGPREAELEIAGPFAYGLLRSEHGVHRAVWITQFNTKGTRERSYAAVEVAPVLEDDDDAGREIEMPANELRVTTMRSSGPGGQSVNRTESAVRIEHIPTGLAVRAEEHRSQHQNHAAAMRRLREKLAALMDRRREERAAAARGEPVSASGSEQVRHYFLAGTRRVKDPRTGHEEADVEGVMGGEVTPFLLAHLRWRNGAGVEGSFRS
ncbi:peptide chain release factor 2 [Hyaloraphidium curvatum]|nr:peptide chain release factor 2 [Hyaloraphidium curvatum]